MMRASYRKGRRFEQLGVDILREHGLQAERIPLSGAAGGRFSGDIVIPIRERDVSLEAKVRRSGFTRIYGWLKGHYAVLAKADRKEPLIVLRLSDFAELAAWAEKARRETRPESNPCEDLP